MGFGLRDLSTVKFLPFLEYNRSAKRALHGAHYLSWEWGLRTIPQSRQGAIPDRKSQTPPGPAATRQAAEYTVLRRAAGRIPTCPCWAEFEPTCYEDSAFLILESPVVSASSPRS